jgi:glycosyltransferase involved in cell wall biosynthesis
VAIAKSFETDGIRYYFIPKQLHTLQSGNHTIDWRPVIEDFLPDFVHIHGTEYGHGLALMNAYPELKYLVSIQGLVSVCYRYFLAGMSVWDVIRNITIRDILRWDTLFHAKYAFYKRGLVEREYINRANVVIGRTDWDHAHSIAINPKVNYQFCNESLRNEFYTKDKWRLESCRRYSIFLSQAYYPIKGLHQVLKAVALLKGEYPDIFIEVAGHDITN